MRAFPPKRQVVEQVLGRLDALGRKQFRHLRTNAAHIHHWGIEAGHNKDAKAFFSWIGMLARQSAKPAPTGVWL